MQPGRGWRRRCPALALLAALAIAPAARAAEPPITIETIRVGFGERDQYEVGSWAPVWVDLKGGPARFAGVLEVVVTDDDGTPTSFRHVVDVPAHQFTTVPTYARPGRQHAEFTVSVYEEGVRRPRASKTVSPADGALNPGQALILTMGRASGIEGVGGGTGPDLASTQAAPFVVAPARVPDGIPGRWYGYEAAEVVVVNANATDAFDALNGLRGEALKEWVRNGGHLVLAIGEKWQQVNGSVLEPMLPAVPRGRTRLADLGALESFANSKSPIPAGDKMTVTQLEPVEARGGRGLDATSPAPLVVRGHYGFGRVTVVGLDVDQKPFTDWPDRKDFWAKVLDFRRRADNPNAPGAAPGGFFNNNVGDLATLLHSRLEQFRGVTLVPFPYVAFFVFVYIVLIGPGDYFFLKKVVKRMELTWITFPLIVATVSLLAYVAAYAVKGTELKVNKVDAVDVDQAAGLARGTTWFTVFSPQNRDYNLAIAPLPLDRDPSAGAAPAPSHAETLLSYFYVPEGPFNMGGPGSMALSTSTYAYAPVGEPRVLEGVRVPIWTTKSFAGRWFAPSRPVVDADLKLSGPDRLAGTVTNRLPRAMTGAFLVYGKQCYELGRLEPGQVRPIGDNPSILSGKLDQLRGRFGNVNNYQPAETLLRDVPPAHIVQVMMFHDAAGTGAAAMSNVPFRDLDLTGQLALDRPMLVAEVEGPASALDLGRTPSAPNVAQTTVLRAILPPAAPEPEEGRPPAGAPGAGAGARP